MNFDGRARGSGYPRRPRRPRRLPLHDVFPVRLRTETFVDVKAGRPGPAVDAWANENG